MMTATCEKIGNWTVKTNREAMKNDPANNKKERYLLQGVETGYTLFDTVEKQFITIKGDKRWENWKAAHAGEWATDF